VRGDVEVAGNTRRNDGAVRLITRSCGPRANDAAPDLAPCAATSAVSAVRAPLSGRARHPLAPQQVTPAHPIETMLDPPPEPGREAGGLER
jgi:hypothetical protein